MTSFQPPRLRLALGLGDQELEQRLRPGLDAADDLSVVAQCLAADQLLQAIEANQVDAAVIGWSLHRLTDALLEQLERPGLVVVLLVPDPAAERWRQRRAVVLGLDTDPSALYQALLAARPGLRPLPRQRAAPEAVALKAADAAQPRRAGVIALCGGAGSPGRTTLSISLAAALGTAASCVLVELDLCAPAVAAYLDRDPSRNVCTLAHSVREDPGSWSAALDAELQPIGPPGLSAVVLCGPPKREMRASIGADFVDRLISELARRYRWVVLDVGPELLGIDGPAASHRAALARAHQIVLAAGSDFVSLWHARVALDQLEHQLGIERRSVSLVLNRYDPRHHHTPSEVEWHLGAPVAGVVPFDHNAAQRALSDQRPLVTDPTSRAGRALLGLAERLNAGKLRLPPGQAGRSPADRWWRRLFEKRRRSARAPYVLDRVAAARRGRAW